MLDFKLPKELIAQQPASPRNHARLLVFNRADKTIYDDYFYNIDKHLHPETTLVLNNSKVDKCRYKFGTNEVFITDFIDKYTFKALVRPGRHFRPGKEFSFDDLKLKTIAIESDGQRIIKSNVDMNDQILDGYRFTPFPPYIKQDESLASEYQTIYAKQIGSKASPTAGLHFTEQQLKKISSKHQLVELTLHVGLGTFITPSDEQIKKSRLHSEKIFLSDKSANQLNHAKHITAVGTTSLRTLESIGRPFREYDGQTDIFIKPGYNFKVVDSLITNFHLPGTSLLMLVCALLGSEQDLERIYQHAINQKYRFYSFGDAMLIL